MAPNEAPQFVINANAIGGQSEKKVYWGVTPPGQMQTTVPGGKGQNGNWIIPGMQANTPQYLTEEQAVGYFYQVAQNDPKLYDAYRQRMQAAGLIDANASGAQMQQVWEAAVNASIKAQGGGVNLTPWDAIDLLGAAGGGQGSGRKNGSYARGFNRKFTTTERNVDLSSASEARAFLMAAAERELGRAPTADEIAAFRRALNEQEQANPETSVTTGTSTGVKVSTFEDGQLVDTDEPNTVTKKNTKTTGGMDRGQFAVDVARSQSDYAEYKAATTYMNAMFQALSSPVGN